MVDKKNTCNLADDSNDRVVGLEEQCLCSFEAKRFKDLPEKTSCIRQESKIDGVLTESNTEVQTHQSSASRTEAQYQVALSTPHQPDSRLVCQTYKA